MTLSELIATGFTQEDLPRFSQVRAPIIRQLRLLWERLGVKPIITSSFRTAAENLAAGGVPASQHLVGRAVDVLFPGVNIHHVVTEADDLNFAGLAVQWPSGSIHLDMRPSLQRARWGEIVEAGIKTHNHPLVQVLNMFPWPSGVYRKRSLLVSGIVVALAVVCYLVFAR